MYRTPSRRAFNALLCAALCLCALAAAPAVAQDDDVIRLPLEQRVSQLFLISLWGTQFTEVGRDFVQRYPPGGVVLFEYNVQTPAQVAALVNDFQQATLAASGIPLFVAADQEGGRIATFEDGFTAFPVPHLIAATDDPAAAYAYGQAIARELHAVGVNMNFAPVADVETRLANPIIYRRAFGSDPALVAQMVVGMAQGLQDAGVLSVAKHFPGHGDTTDDSHLTLPVVTHDRARLDAVELLPFRAAASAGVAGIMVGHLWYTAFDADALPASLSYNVITGLLRRQLGYDGLVITDALDMDAIDQRYDAADAAVRAVQAGADLLAFGPHLPLAQQEAAIQAVITAVRLGEISEERINESLRRILDAKARYGILDWQPLDPDTVTVPTDVHQALIADWFRAGVTVAVNDGDALPLTRGATPNGVTLVYPANRRAIRAACERYDDRVRWVDVADSPSPDDTARAVSSARGSDRVVVFTQSAFDDTAQAALVNALPPEKTIVVALASPYDWQRFPDVAGYVLTYSPLDPAIPAACAVLFGAAPAPGRLPVRLDLP